MPRPRPLDSWDANLIKVWHDGVEQSITIPSDSADEARSLRKTLYAVRESMRRAKDYDKRIDRVQIKLRAYVLVVEPKRNVHAKRLDLS